jgi:hypothetical protein
LAYHEQGVQEILTGTLQYDSQNRITSMTANADDGSSNTMSFSYTASGDTTIMKVKYDEDPEEEIIKMKYDSNGKLLFLITYLDNVPDEKTIYSYNSSGDLVKETYQLLTPQGLSSGDSTTYQWDLANHRIFEKQFDNGEIKSTVEYEIDNNKRILKVYDYECDENCVKSGSYVEYIYNNSSVKKNMQHSVIALQRNSGNEMFSIDGRMMVKNQKSAKGILVDRKNCRIFQNSFMR